MSNEFWEIIKPKTTTNLIINPSVEKDTTGWTGNGSSISRDTTEQIFGISSLKGVTGAGTADHLYFTTGVLSSGTTYTFSAYFKASAGNPYVIAIANTSSIVQSSTTFTSTGEWQRVSITRTEDSSVARRLLVGKNSDATVRTFFVDAALFEIQSEATTYCDGDQPGCAWSGGPHTSQSTRSAFSRAGGQIVNLKSDYEIIVRQQPGAGMPNISNIRTELGLQDGAIFQRNRVLTRSITLDGVVSGSNVNDYHFNRQRLIDLVKPDLTPGDEPFLLRYTGVNNVTKQIECYYDGGLELGTVTANIELFTMRLIAFNPFWEEVGNDAKTFDGQTVITSVNGLIQRSSAGVWEAPTGLPSATDAINSVKRGNDGLLYAGGLFGQISGSNNIGAIAAWDGATWWRLSEGVKRSYSSCGPGRIESIAIDSNGDVYVGGEFDIAGCIAACGIARWDISASSWSSVVDIENVGLNLTRVKDLHFVADGTLYAAGSFQDAGGSANVNHILKYDGTNACPLGSGANAGGSINGLASNSDNQVYVGGSFETIDGVSSSGIALWNNPTTSFSAIGSSPQIANIGTNLIHDVDVGPDGRAYITGEFETISGISTCHAAVWDGVGWNKLGATEQLKDKTGTTTGRTIFADQSTNLIYFGGTMTKAGGFSLKDGYAIWNGTTWIVPDIDLSSQNRQINTVLREGDGTLTVGYTLNATGPDTACAATGSEIANTGTAKTSPCVVFSGAGTTIQVRNDTTNKQIQFDFVLQPGEEVTLDVGNKTLNSTFSGNIIGNILPGGDLADWQFNPGQNNVSAFIDSESGSAIFKWKKRHWTFDGGAS